MSVNINSNQQVFDIVGLGACPIDKVAALKCMVYSNNILPPLPTIKAFIKDYKQEESR